MSPFTLHLETEATAEPPAAKLAALANVLGINIATVWNGLDVVARPGMTGSDVLRDYDLSFRLSQHPKS